MRSAVLLALLVVVVVATDNVKITEELKSSLIAQTTAPNAACGAGSHSLSGLTKTATNSDYKGSDASYDYYMNVCAPSTTAQGSQGFGIIQYIKGGFVFVASLGTWPLAVWSAPTANSVVATLSDGEKCYIAGEYITRTAIVTFTCSSATNPTFTVSEGQNNCVFNIGLAAVCGGGSSGGGGGLSGGSVFLIILVVVIPIYIAAGFVYKMKVKGTTGMESCPNIEFWREIPGLVKDGFRFTISKVRGASSSHSQIP